MVALEQYPAIGTVLAGKYRVEAMLGEGGMGAVFRATEGPGPNEGRPVAIKFTSLEVRNRPGIAGRFANEALAASKIASEHAVKIYGVEATAEGTPFIVMELLSGRDLDQIIEAEAPLGVERAVHFALQILRALQVAHGVGVVHRDLKPSNCFVVQHDADPDFVKLIDFGITKILGDEASQLTKTSTTLGTPAYMAPEQAKSAKAADPRSDLYSMGVILYELLTKKRPFDGDSHNELVIRICTEPPVPLRSHRTDLPSKLVAAVEHALVKSPTGRYQTAREFADALAPFAGPQSTGVLARIAAGASGTPAPIASVSPIAQSLPAGAAAGVGGGLPAGLPQTSVRVGAAQTPGFAMANTPLSEEPPRAAGKAAGSTAPMNDFASAQTVQPAQLEAARVAAMADLGSASTAPVAQPQRAEAARQEEKTLLGEVGPMDFAAHAAPPIGAPPIAPGAAGPPIAPMGAAAASPYTPAPSTEDRRGGGGRGGLFVVLGLLALGLIAFGVYAAVGGLSSSAPAPTPTPAATTAAADDNADDTVTTPKKKKKHDAPATPANATVDDPTPTVAPPAPGPQHTGVKPHPSASGKPTTTTTTTGAPTTPPPFPFPFPFPTDSAAAPAKTTPPPTATTAAPPPATTTAPPPPAAGTIAVPPPATNNAPPKPKIGGGG